MSTLALSLSQPKLLLPLVFLSFSICIHREARDAFTCLQYKMRENKMADHRKSCLRAKLPPIPVMSVTNRYAATMEMSISIVDVRVRIDLDCLYHQFA